MEVTCINFTRGIGEDEVLNLSPEEIISKGFELYKQWENEDWAIYDEESGCVLIYPSVVKSRHLYIDEDLQEAAERRYEFSNGVFNVRIGTTFHSIFDEGHEPPMIIVGFRDSLIIAKSRPDSEGEIWYAPSHMKWEEFLTY